MAVFPFGCFNLINATMNLPKHLDLRHMAIFSVVAETKSMAAAAERFGVTQAAVSQAVARLEHAVGRDLIDRSTRPFQVTAAGVFLERQGREIVAQAAMIHRTLTSGVELAVPELRLSVVDSFIGATMPTLLKQLSDGIRTDRIVLLSGLTDSNIAAVSEGRVDGAITSDAVDIGSSFPSRPLLRERFVAIAPKDAAETDVGELAAGRHFISFPFTSPMGRQIRAHFGRAQLTLEARMVMDRPEFALAAVAEGQGWTIATPLCIAASAIEPTSVKIVKIARNPGWRSLAFITRPREMTQTNIAISRIALKTVKAVLPERLSAFPDWLSGEVEFASETSKTDALDK